MVIKRYTHQTAKRFWNSHSDFIPANSAAAWTTWEDWGSGGGGGVCVGGGGGDEAISK